MYRAKASRARALLQVDRALMVVSWILREPLFAFLVIAGLFWIIVPDPQASRIDRAITIGDKEVNKIVEGWQRQFGEIPSAELREQLIQNYITEEALYRQALAYHLDNSDPIVRSRLVQKMRLIMQDLEVPVDPNRDELIDYYNTNSERYVLPTRIDFRHVFFTVTKESEDRMQRQRAIQALADKRTEGTENESIGDVFTGANRYQGANPANLKALFGESKVVGGLLKSPLARWHGPYRSIYGWHIVFVEKRTESILPSFGEVSASVKRDFLRERADTTNKQRVEAVVSGYQVIREDI